MPDLYVVFQQEKRPAIQDYSDGKQSSVRMRASGILSKVKGVKLGLILPNKAL
jgi:hypothetical protein